MRGSAVSVAFEETCIFCKIGRGDFKTKMIAETQRCVAFSDIDPKAPVHVLVIPRAHVSSLAELRDPELAAELMLLCAEVARVQNVDQSGYRVISNVGRDAGQSVNHLHLHVIGGRALGLGLD